MPSSTLRVAVLILPPIQLLDLSPIDLFHMLSKEYLTECSLPQPFIDQGLDTVSIHYVGENGPSSSQSASDKIALAQMTANARIVLTNNFSSPEVQPGQIDIILIPGPDPSLIPSDAAKAFIRKHNACKTTTILSVCTGIFPLAHSGVLDGRVCTGPRALLGSRLRPSFPKAKWVEKRWAIDLPSSQESVGAAKRETAAAADLWTAGGITNGQDMVAAYIRKNFKRELADLVRAMADVGKRSQEYDNGAAAEGMWWGWLLLRSWTGGLFGRGKGGKS